jgi:hypothetical protein
VAVGKYFKKEKEQRRRVFMIYELRFMIYELRFMIYELRFMIYEL